MVADNSGKGERTHAERLVRGIPLDGAIRRKLADAARRPDVAVPDFLTAPDAMEGQA